jgi:HEAT repeat protein
VKPAGYAAPNEREDFGRLRDLRKRKDVLGLAELAEDENVFMAWRLSAIRALGAAGDPGAYQPLQRLVRSERREPRVTSVVALGKLCISDAEPMLIQLLGDEDDAIASNAAIGLGRLGRETSVPALIRALDFDAWATRLHAARALSKIGGPEAAHAVRSLRRREHGKRRLWICLAHVRMAK